MSNNGALLDSFGQNVTRRRGALETKVKALSDGIVALNELLNSVADDTKKEV
jgi:hypothetical protein